MTNVPVIVVWLLPEAPPAIPPVTVGALHEYVVPVGIIFDTEIAGVTANNEPLHTVAVNDSVMAGFGLTMIL